MRKIKAILLYWLREYDYTLEEHFDGDLWLHDNQDSTVEDRPVTLIELCDMFISQLENKRHYADAEATYYFTFNINALEEYKRELKGVKA